MSLLYLLLSMFVYWLFLCWNFVYLVEIHSENIAILEEEEEEKFISTISSEIK